MALLAAAPLLGCGFRPAYGPGGSGAALLGAVEIDTPPGLHEFTLGQQLQNRFGTPAAPRYSLAFSLRTREEGVAITAEQDTNRFNLLGQADYRLSDLQDGATAASGRVEGFTSFSTTGTTVATQAAERDAYDRLMVQLADRIVARLIAAGPSAPDASAGAPRGPDPVASGSGA